jgi:glycosyltransferase involved in cell wall biosynthesis
VISEGFQQFLLRRSGGRKETVSRICEALKCLRPVTNRGSVRRLFLLACFSESDEPSGGHKMLYRHVDVLNSHGYQASAIHARPGFRYSWFANRTQITYLEPGVVTTSDLVVVPETMGPYLGEIAPGCRKVVFNQNCYYTFLNYPLTGSPCAYEHPDVRAAIVVSQDSEDYLRHVFPKLAVYRIHYSIDTNLFRPAWPKKRVICCMPRKRRNDLCQVLNILACRGALEGVEVAPIENLPEREVAALLGECQVFLSTSEDEGFGLPAAEAMACGCIVVGFHGGGGREFMRPDCAYPVAGGDVLGFASTVERVLKSDAETLRQRGEAAATLIRETYSAERETADIIRAWERILA